MNWNYRIIKQDTEEVPYFAVHEVYYNKAGQIISWTAEPIAVTGESRTDILNILKQITEDCTLPCLSETEITKTIKRNTHI